MNGYINNAHKNLDLQDRCANKPDRFCYKNLKEAQ